MADVIFNEELIVNMDEIIEHFEYERRQGMPTDVAILTKRFQRNLEEVIDCLNLNRIPNEEMPDAPIPKTP